MKTQLELGVDAMARGVFLRKDLGRIEVHEDEMDPYNLLTARVFVLKSNTEAGWREHNMVVLREVHEFVQGGVGRYVDESILRGWEALGLADRSVRVDMSGQAM